MRASCRLSSASASSRFTEELRDAASARSNFSHGARRRRRAASCRSNFRVTLPKVTLPDEVAALADICSRLEPTLDLEPGALRIELMIETPQAIFNERGEVESAAAGQRRARPLHRACISVRTITRLRCNIAAPHQP